MRREEGEKIRAKGGKGRVSLMTHLHIFYFVELRAYIRHMTFPLLFKLTMVIDHGNIFVVHKKSKEETHGNR